MAVLSTYPLLQRLTGSFDPMATLDHIRLEAYWPWGTVEFQEETTGIAQNGTDFVPSPEWCCRSGTVLTYRLEMSTIMVSKYCHHFWFVFGVLRVQATDHNVPDNNKAISKKGRKRGGGKRGTDGYIIIPLTSTSCSSGGGSCICHHDVVSIIVSSVKSNQVSFW